MKNYTLRTAEITDLKFLFNVSTEAMRPVVEELHPGETFESEKEFEKYKEKFIPEKIQIIQCKDQDVGRLRVVRTNESIYIGGIQILPAFQGKGIGAAIFNDLMEEANKNNLLIILEVHDVNIKALAFYKKLGFVESGRQRELKKSILTYRPS
jgi:GNAT superfamily N-acetyltransferase